VRVRPLTVVAAIALAGCAMTSPQLKPDVPMPTAWNEGAAVPEAAIPLDWWQSFRSGELARLVEQALAGSPDLAIATERVTQAEALVSIARASLFPTLDLDAATARRESRGGGAPRTTVDSTSASLFAAYELDLWGRIAAGVSSAKSTLTATEYDRETVRLTLVATVAAAYFDVLSLRGRIAIQRQNLTTAERVLGVVEARYRNGVASPLDVARQRTGVLNLRAAIEPLELQERQTRAALAVLVGRPPEGFTVAGASLEGLAPPAVAPDLPSSLLVRRPDIAAAEAALAAANADVAAARAALLPAITLTGSAGLVGASLFSFGSSPTTILSLAAALAQPIFDGGRRRATVDLTESRERELVQGYRAAILAGFADVENALAAASRTASQEGFQEQAQTEARRALALAEIRYREGADDLLVVLDAQRTAFITDDQLAQTRLARLQAAVGLYRALGGGWTVPAAAARAGG
jgi:NodT family efflux transporter outer membrane factor (OMF) lipoprotein